MLEKKLWKFIAKRAIVILILLSLLVVICMREKWLILAGLLLGGIFSVLKFYSFTAVFSNILVRQDKSGRTVVIIRFIVNQVVTVVLLAATLIVNLWLFAGAAAGILLVPAAVFINCITEIIGITHNNFE